eukprot:6306370-Prymnesium_polylepis.1
MSSETAARTPDRFAPSPSLQDDDRRRALGNRTPLPLCLTSPPSFMHKLSLLSGSSAPLRSL